MIQGIPESYRDDFLNFNEIRTERRTKAPLFPLIEK